MARPRRRRPHGERSLTVSVSSRKKEPRDFLTLPEAARELGVSEITVRRLSKTPPVKDRPDLEPVLSATRRVVGGRRRLVIERWALERYRLLRWLGRQLSDVPPLEGHEGTLGPVYVYGAWGEPHPGGRLPTFELTVSLEDFYRFACQPIGSRDDYDTLKAALRARLPSPHRPEHFRIRYRLDASTVSVLRRIIASVPPPRLVGKPFGELKTEALTHLVMVTLPRLARARRGWVGYLCQAVRNFYTDQGRRDTRQTWRVIQGLPTDSLEDEDPF